MRTITRLPGKPIEECAQCVQRRVKGLFAERLPCPSAQLLSEMAFYTYRLLGVKFLEVPVFCILFEAADCGRGDVDRMFAQAPCLFQIDKIGPLDPLVIWVVFSHRIRRAYFVY